MPKQPAPDLATALEDIRRRLSRLEAARTPPKAVALDAERYWVLDELSRRGKKGGEVVYGGMVSLPTGGQVVWQREAPARELLGRDWTGLDRVLAALGHPVRLALLQAILRGRQAKADLERLEGLGTTGQLYHHLKALEESGWVRSLERGVWGVPAERVVPLLAILAAAAG